MQKGLKNKYKEILCFKFFFLLFFISSHFSYMYFSSWQNIKEEIAIKFPSGKIFNDRNRNLDRLVFIFFFLWRTDGKNNV